MPIGRLWYAELSATENAIGHAIAPQPADDVVIRVYDAPGNITETHEHFDDFKKWLVRDALVATVVFERSDHKGIRTHLRNFVMLREDNGNYGICTNRAELRSSSVRNCPKEPFFLHASSKKEDHPSRPCEDR